MKTFDFVAIGDTVTDAFIQISDATVTCDTHGAHCLLCVRFGDKVPYDSVEVVKAVGNSANAAVSAARLGLSSALISDLGKDDTGKDSLSEFRKNKVSTKFITLHKGMVSNYHYVLQHGPERTILVKHQEYPYVLPKKLKAKWLYLSSLGENSLPYHEEIALFLKNNPETKLAFQPGTFQIKLGIEKLKGIYSRTEVFFCNVEESQTILNETSRDLKVLLSKMRELGPKIVVITDGPNGAYTFDGNEMLKIAQYPDPKPPVSRTGAGDAFSSTFIAALDLGKSVREALAWGPINSMAVVQQVGAQKGLLSRAALEQFLKDAPKDYAVTTL